MKKMLDKEEWSRNVGTPSYPVSFLHEYAIGLIWDLFHTVSGVLELPTINGERSSDVHDGTDQIIIPDALQSIGGYTPDISLLKDSRPIRCIEVVVTSPVDPRKQKAIKNLGVDLIQVPVRNEDELRALTSIESTTDNRNLWWAQFNPEEQRFRPRGGVNWEISRQYRILEAQEEADNKINKLMNDLSRCSPKVRRAFVDKLTNLSSLESLYPIQKDNPKYKVLYPEKTNPEEDIQK